MNVNSNFVIKTYTSSFHTIFFRRDLFNEFNLDLKIRDLFTSEADSLKKIINDLRH